MYAGIDIGATKTLLASLDGGGVITEKKRFETPTDYGEFLEKLAESVESLTTQSFQAAAAGIPAVTIDRVRGIGLDFGNLPWQNVPIEADAEKLLHCPVAVENDAKLASLSEAMLLKERYHKVLYVTVSTGIGYGLTVDGVIDTNLGDGGGRTILLDHKGRLTPWEDFASGRAIVRRYGKQARDITDETTWRSISHDLAQGLIELIAVMQPDVIVLGGSVGTYFERYQAQLEQALQKFDNPLIKLPPLLKAGRPEEAVLFGCYDLASSLYPVGPAAAGAHQT